MNPTLRRFWLWWGETYFVVFDREVELPWWPWRLYCAVRRHQVVEDHCLLPGHRYCAVCWTSTPGAKATEPRR